jgi:hypothetical protein
MLKTSEVFPPAPVLLLEHSRKSKMKPRNFAALALVLSLASCETMHNAAVSTFKVVDTPHQYIRRQLGLDEQDQPAATTTTTETTIAATGNPPPPPAQPNPGQPQPFQNSNGTQPPPPSEPPPQVTSRERTVAPPPQSNPTATPRIAANENRKEPKASSTPSHPSSTQSTSDLPYAKPVPGKPGYVYSPYDPNGGYVDVKGFAPGQKVKDPYSGKIFLVP